MKLENLLVIVRLVRLGGNLKCGGKKRSCKEMTYAEDRQWDKPKKEKMGKLNLVSSLLFMGLVLTILFFTLENNRLLNENLSMDAKQVLKVDPVALASAKLVLTSIRIGDKIYLEDECSFIEKVSGEKYEVTLC